MTVGRLLAIYGAGFAYMLLPVAHPLHGRIQLKNEQAALDRMAAAAASGDATAA